MGPHSGDTFPGGLDVTEGSQALSAPKGHLTREIATDCHCTDGRMSLVTVSREDVRAQHSQGTGAGEREGNGRTTMTTGHCCLEP